MKTSYDIETILHKLLSRAYEGILKGGVYKFGDRPTDSKDEDAVIQTNYITQEYLPQTGSSTIYIYVPDAIVSIGGSNVPKTNHKRLKYLSDIAIKAIRESRIEGLKIIVENQVRLRDFDIKQNLTAIRLSWNIQTN